MFSFLFLTVAHYELFVSFLCAYCFFPLVIFSKNAFFQDMISDRQLELGDSYQTFAGGDQEDSVDSELNSLLEKTVVVVAGRWKTGTALCPPNSSVEQHFAYRQDDQRNKPSNVEGTIPDTPQHARIGAGEPVHLEQSSCSTDEMVVPPLDLSALLESVEGPGKCWCCPVFDDVSLSVWLLILQGLLTSSCTLFQNFSTTFTDKSRMILVSRDIFSGQKMLRIIFVTIKCFIEMALLC